MSEINEDEMEQNLISALAYWGFQIHELAKEKGWWDKPRNFGELIALTHSELSEALEASRQDFNKPSAKIPGFTEIEEELADVYIRILDMATHYNLKLGEAVLAKLDYNAGRPHRHGKLF